MPTVRLRLLLASALGAACTPMVDVPPGFEGAEYEVPAWRSEGGGFKLAQVLTPGRHRLGRLNSVAIIMDTRPKAWTLKGIKVRMSDELNVSFDITLTTVVKKGHGPELLGIYATRPTDSNADVIESKVDWYRIVEPVFQSVTRTRLSQESSLGIAKKRGPVAADILSGLNEQLREEPVSQHVEFTRLVIGNIDYPESVDKAIQARAEAEQTKAKKEMELEIARADAAIARVEAEGMASAQAIIDETLTPEYLTYEWIKALERAADTPNTTIIYVPVGPNGMPIMSR